jgi:hypothetical protein
MPAVMSAKGVDWQLYSKCLKLFFSGTVGLVILRCLLKILFVDTSNGFYFSGEIFVIIFNVLLLLTGGGVVILSLFKKDSQSAVLHGDRFLEFFSILLGISILFVSIGAFISALSIDPRAPGHKSAAPMAAPFRTFPWSSLRRRHPLPVFIFVQRQKVRRTQKERRLLLWWFGSPFR